MKRAPHTSILEGNLSNNRLLVAALLLSSSLASEAFAQGLFPRIRARRATIARQTPPTVHTRSRRSDPSLGGGRLGVRIHDTDGNGARITFIEPNSPALRSGLMLGDRVFSVGGRLVRDTAELIRAVSSHSPGDTVTVHFVRSQRTYAARVTLFSTRRISVPELVKAPSPDPTPSRQVVAAKAPDVDPLEFGDEPIDSPPVFSDRIVPPERLLEQSGGKRLRMVTLPTTWDVHFWSGRGGGVVMVRVQAGCPDDALNILIGDGMVDTRIGDRVLFCVVSNRSAHEKGRSIWGT